MNTYLSREQPHAIAVYPSGRVTSVSSRHNQLNMGTSPSKQIAYTAQSRAASPTLSGDVPDQDQKPSTPSMPSTPSSPSTSSPPSTPSAPCTPSTPSSPPFDYAAYEYEYTYPFCPCCHRDFRESCDDHRDTSRQQDEVIRRSFGIEAEKLGMDEEYGVDELERENKVTGGTERWERDLNDLERVLMWPHVV
ncbi:unnamed protein product [Zymoseptoria tritici ST99CH_1E4]|uniref:Uncharacterized protein n=1 Tax=Zymoseptoria tritici ST99CH_1E4 TaxID=1276532 RepID=A0A2H1GMJ2_ZYMTR|nr:unnamed protein product [Zymoseptoria tritici ST99CH_1E4]